MATITASAPTTTTRGRRARAIGVTVGSALVAWLAIEQIGGVNLYAPSFQPGAAPQDVNAGAVAVTAAMASLAGWGLLALLERKFAGARRIWTAVAVLFTFMSLGGPFGGSGVTASNRVGLAALHLVVAAVLIPTLSRTSTRGAR